ncbi:MAG: hypothetical protein ACK58T_12435, partial [Phycisphaerae bacterium]
ANDFFWDFGVPGTDADTSNIPSPTFTYPGPGIYTIMLIANPTWTCADTAMTVWQVYPPMEPDIVVSGGDCVNNQVLYNFTYTASASASATVQWNFGMGSSPSGSTAPFPSGVALNPEANEHLVTLSITDN